MLALRSRLVSNNYSPRLRAASDFGENTERRYFIGAALAAAVVRNRAAAASDKVRLGIIGLRSRGNRLSQSFAGSPDAEIAYLCDVDRNVLEKVASDFEQKYGKRPARVGDLRRILDDSSIDAVVIATPDHWHTPAAILACQAGKDVYVEKPCCHNLREGWMLVNAARKYNRIVQHGTQNRSSAPVRWMIDYIQSGKIGKVLMAKAWNVQLRKDIGHKQDSPVPAGVDYDTSIGPAPVLPFNENRFHYNWHWQWNYGTGDIGNDGTHQIDIARWALGVEHPDEVSGMGRKLFFDDDQQTPATMTINYNHKDKVLMFEMRIWNPYKMDWEQRRFIANLLKRGKEGRPFQSTDLLERSDEWPLLQNGSLQRRSVERSGTGLGVHRRPPNLRPGHGLVRHCSAIARLHEQVATRRAGISVLPLGNNRAVEPAR